MKPWDRHVDPATAAASSRSAAGSFVYLLALLSLVVGFGVAGCTQPEEHSERLLFSIQGSSMGTYYVVKAVENTREAREQDQSSERLLALVEEELDGVDRRMSTYRDDSELSRFNQSESTAAFEMSAETIGVIAAALDYGAQTGGALDVTIGPLVKFWGFGAPPLPEGSADEASSLDESLPSMDSEESSASADGAADALADALADDDASDNAAGNSADNSVDNSARAARFEAARALVGLEHLAVNRSANTVTKTIPGLAVDLSSIAKGYAVDRVLERLLEEGYRDVMVEVGGEVRTAGVNVEGHPWRLGIERPVAGRGRVQRIVDLDDLAMATSGDYRQYREIDGERFSHLIDPRTGQPIGHRLASVSVIAETCMRADALATALMVLGETAGLTLANSLDVAALFLVRSDDGFVERPSARFQENHMPQSEASL